MLLVIDIGNTNGVIGLFAGQTLVADFRIESRRNRTSDEYYALLEPMFRRAGYSMASVADVVVATVVPPTVYPLTRFAQELTGREPFFVDHRLDVGLKLLYHRPEEMGADRLVNAVYAWRKWGGSIVVDFGTATTFDVVNAAGEYLGGCIVPGIRISMDALFDYAARLPRIEVGRPDHAIGRSTEEAMKAGVYYGYVAMVDGLARRLQREAGFPARVIATGGLATMIAQDSEAIEVVDSNLTLLSLEMLYREYGGRR
ncbi:MAG: type III pantothenate kinase [Deltaproteobacteria bacterium]|nr:type III pantothenate kinase [Deltaproteobacteria bacterium]